MSERDVFLQALEIKEQAERAAFLDQACADQPGVRSQVDQLLKAHDLAGQFLNQPHPLAAAAEQTRAYVPPFPAEQAGQLIAGKYKLLQRIGEGGMGSVWMADQLEPVKRRVAVKLISTERGASHSILSRFEAERQAIALMDHPHIAKLLDAGTTDGEQGRVSARTTPGADAARLVGRPFFVMELVKGVPLADFCDEHKLSIPDRLHLFIQICSAVQHAHQKGIIHRDLKPTNILVEMHDDKPVPKVIDFGLAKALSGQPLTEHTLFTGFGTVAGTPLYMAPEQAKFNAIDIDTRADIYALGVILYELLTGSTPIERASLKQAAFDEVLRMIRESEPQTPSKRLSTTQSKPSVAANRHTEPEKLGRFVKGELDWIVMKALAKERDRRYETANGLARDIERFLNHEPVLAGPPTASYRLRKFVRRNRGQVIAASLVLLALMAGIAGTTLGLIRAEQQRQFALANEEKAIEAAQAERQARDQEAQQRAKAEKARDRTREALDAMTSTVTGDSLSTQREISPDQKKFLTEVLKYYQEFAGEKADDETSRARTAAAAHRVGMVEYRLGRHEQASLAFQMARDCYDRLATDFPAVPGYRRELANTDNSLGILTFALGKWPEAEAEYHKAVAIKEKLVTEFPAEAAYRSDLAASYANLGVLLANLGKHQGAEEHHRKALAIEEKLAAEFPAVAEYRHDLAMNHINLGALLSDLGNRSEAEGEYRKAIAIHQKLVADFPAEAAYRKELATGHNNLGYLLRNTGRWLEGEGEYRKALVIREKLAVDFPAAPEYRFDLAFSHRNLGGLLTGLEGVGEYRKAMAILQQLVADFPTVPEYRAVLARSHNDLGLLFKSLGKPSEAEKECRTALTIQEKLVAEFPDVLAYQLGLGGSYCNFGNLVCDAGRANESLGWFDKAIRTLTPAYDKDHRLVKTREFLCNSHTGRAEAYERLQKHDMAVKDWNRTIELSPKDVSRAAARAKAGQVAEAIAEADELAKSSNWNADNWYNFACVYAIASSKSAQKKQEYADRAMELLSKAVKTGYKDAGHMKQDTDLESLHDRADFKKLLGEVSSGKEVGRKR
jgi:serine/threonine protein kinase